MDWIQKNKKLLDELKQLENLADHEINTSDIPELDNWDEAVQGMYANPQKGSEKKTSNPSQTVYRVQVFDEGETQLIQLPEHFRIDSNEVILKKIGNCLLLLPASQSWKTFQESLQEFSEDFFDDLVRDKPDSTRRDRPAYPSRNKQDSPSHDKPDSLNDDKPDSPGEDMFEVSRFSIEEIGMHSNTESSNCKAKNPSELDSTMNLSETERNRKTGDCIEQIAESSSDAEYPEKKETSAIQSRKETLIFPKEESTSDLELELRKELELNEELKRGEWISDPEAATIIEQLVKIASSTNQTSASTRDSGSQREETQIKNQTISPYKIPETDYK